MSPPAAPPAFTDAAIEQQIFGLLSRRAPEATVCPSEVARGLAAPAAGADWRALMPEVRRVAQALAEAGRLQVTRGGEVVDATAPGGPIRLGRP